MVNAYLYLSPSEKNDARVENLTLIFEQIQKENSNKLHIHVEETKLIDEIVLPMFVVLDEKEENVAYQIESIYEMFGGHTLTYDNVCNALFAAGVLPKGGNEKEEEKRQITERLHVDEAVIRKYEALFTKNKKDTVKEDFEALTYKEKLIDVFRAIEDPYKQRILALHIEQDYSGNALKKNIDMNRQYEKSISSILPDILFAKKQS